jgi:putative hemolysin
MEIIFQLLLVLLLVLLNGFFVASEFALVAVRKTRIDELAKRGNAVARLVQGSLQDLDSYISATQLGITLASLALGWVGEPAIAHLLEPFFSFLPKNAAFITAHGLSVVAAFSIITFLHIVLGELAPKTIALQRSEATSLVIITPLLLFTKIFRPFIWILNGAGAIVLRIFGFKASPGHHTIYSEDEIKMILAQSTEGGVINKEEVEMVYNVFKLGDIPIKQLMIPRTDVIAFPKDITLKELIRKIKKYTHSRYPIYDLSIDSIVGFIHIKDIYNEIIKTADKKLFSTKLIRKIIIVPETKKADDVLLDMRRRRAHMAIVQDEYGGTSGVVTLEDIIENIIGDIEDEFDRPLHGFKKQPDGSYLIDGQLSIEEVRKRFKFSIKGQGYTTIGGLIFGLLGREPEVGNKIQLGQITFIIEEMEKRRIKLLRVIVEKKNRKLS